MARRERLVTKSNRETDIRHEGNEAIAFDAVVELAGQKFFRRGVIVRREDELVYVLVQAMEPTSSDFEALAFQFFKSFKFNGGSQFLLPPHFAQSRTRSNQVPATKEKPSWVARQEAGIRRGYELTDIALAYLERYCPDESALQAFLVRIG